MAYDQAVKPNYHGVHVARSKAFNLDNGAGTTADDVLIAPQPRPIKIVRARIVYTDATSGTVAAGNARIGTTVGGSEVVASTAYENAKAVGTKTDMTLVSAAAAKIPANAAVHCRHTGVAVTQAGEAYVEIEYVVDETPA